MRFALDTDGYLKRDPTRIIAIDIDDTLVRHTAPPDMLDPASIDRVCQPIADACRHARHLIAEGREVHFVTGRTPRLSEVTLRQLRAWVHPEIDATRVHFGSEWQGYEALAIHKAGVLRRIGAHVMVGDHASDAWAAFQANISYLHAEKFTNDSALSRLVLG